MGLVLWIDPGDCDPPHGLDLRTPRDARKVNDLMEAFGSAGFDRSKPAVVGYPLNGRIQLLSGTHRHEAATRTTTKLPVVLWLRSVIEASWGDLTAWIRVMEDISVAEFETWSRADIDDRSDAAFERLQRVRHLLVPLGSLRA